MYTHDFEIVALSWKRRTIIGMAKEGETKVENMG
jgi:hypothetical protein